MKIQAQPDYLIFADEAKTGELDDFPNIARGWGVTIDQTQSKPPLEWMNGAFNRIDKNTLYLLQQGIPEWNKAVTYPVNAVIKYKGVLYLATTQNDNATPSTSTTKWSKLIPETLDASLSQKGVVQLSSAIDSDSEATAATSKAVKDVASNALLKTGGTVTGDTNFTGKLQQGGSDVITEENLNDYAGMATLVDAYKSEDGANWYRKWSDGFIEQGGYAAVTGNVKTINLLTPMKTNKYTVSANTSSANLTTGATLYTQIVGKKTVTSFLLLSGGTGEASNGVEWIARGY